MKIGRSVHLSLDKKLSETHNQMVTINIKSKYWTYINQSLWMQVLTRIRDVRHP